MNLSVVPLSRIYAEEFVRWEYNEPYSFYTIPQSSWDPTIDYISDPKNQFYAVLCDSEFIAFRSFGKCGGGRIEGGDYDDTYTDTGGGMRPNLTGQGLGKEVIEAGLRFGVEQLGYEKYQMTVGTFNHRALKVIEKIGFQRGEVFSRSQDNKEFVILTLDSFA